MVQKTHRRPGSRPLAFWKIRPDPSLDPTDESRERRDSRAPIRGRDYDKSSWNEILNLDLTRAALIIDASYSCNYHCVYCNLASTNKRPVDWPQVRILVKALALAGLRRAVLSGGEPGIFKESPRILADLASLKIKTTVLTNGIWAKDEGRLEKIVRAGTSGFLVSVKAFDEESIERVTGRRTPDAAWRTALLNFSRQKELGTIEYFGVNHVLTSATLETLAGTFWLDALPVRPQVILSLVEPYTSEMAALVPDPRELQSRLASLFDVWDRLGIDYRVEGMPLCLLGQRWPRSRDRQRLSDHAPRVFIQPGQDRDHVMAFTGYQRLLQFSKLPVCAGCARRGECPGVHKGVRHLYDERLLRPFRG